jgi:hypothetical protein
LRQARFLLLLCVVFSFGCVAPAAVLLSTAVKGVPGMKKDNAGQKETAAPEMLVAKSVSPRAETFNAPFPKCMSAVVETMLQNGDTLESVSDEQVRTVKKKIPPELEPMYPAICSNDVSIVKIVTLSKQEDSTTMSMVVEAYRKAIWSGDVEREWVSLESKLNDDFFKSVSDKIKPVQKKRRKSKRTRKST